MHYVHQHTTYMHLHKCAAELTRALDALYGFTGIMWYQSLRFTLLELIHGKIQTTLTRYKLSRQVFCSLRSPPPRARDSSTHKKKRQTAAEKIYISIEQMRLSRSAQNEPGLELEFLTAVVIFALLCWSHARTVLIKEMVHARRSPGCLFLLTVSALLFEIKTIYKAHSHFSLAGIDVFAADKLPFVANRWSCWWWKVWTENVHVYSGWKSQQHSSSYLKCKTMFAEAKAASESK
jgi:hypothetical protein